MNKLPNEVIYIIFNYIEINDLGLICETNKQLYNLGIEYRKINYKKINLYEIFKKNYFISKISFKNEYQLGIPQSLRDNIDWDFILN